MWPNLLQEQVLLRVDRSTLDLVPNLELQRIQTLRLSSSIENEILVIGRRHTSDRQPDGNASVAATKEALEELAYTLRCLLRLQNSLHLEARTAVGRLREVIYLEIEVDRLLPRKDAPGRRCDGPGSP